MTWSARFHGVCARCGGKIREGDAIDWDDVDERTVRHEACEEPLELAPRPVCGACFMEISLSGACGC